MNPPELIHLRLHSQRLPDAPFIAPAEVVQWFGAMQAQEYLQAVWAIGLRMQHATQATIEQAVVDRTIVRTWPMRSTVHFVDPMLVRAILKLLTPRVISRSRSIYRSVGLEPSDFTRSADVLTRTLSGGKNLTRPVLYEALQAAGITTDNMRGMQITNYLSQTGLLCYAALEGKQPTFALLDEWVPPAPVLTDDEVLAEWARRYYRSHGPATLQDFMWWSGLTKAEATATLDGIKGELVEATWDGKSYWMSPETAAQSAPEPSTYLLPGFDEYLVAHHHTERRATLVPPVESPRDPREGDLLWPTIVRDGRVLGTWKRTIAKKGVTITLKPFAPLNNAESTAIGEAAERYATFLESPLLAVQE